MPPFRVFVWAMVYSSTTAVDLDAAEIFRKIEQLESASIPTPGPPPLTDLGGGYSTMVQVAGGSEANTDDDDRTDDGDEPSKQCDFIKISHSTLMSADDNNTPPRVSRRTYQKQKNLTIIPVEFVLLKARKFM